MEIETTGEIPGIVNPIMNSNNEKVAASAFNKQAPVFDELYSSNTIIQYKRKRVRDHVLKYIPASGNILELNAGTGEDAVYFARAGHTVHATDISEGMQEPLHLDVGDSIVFDIQGVPLRARISGIRKVEWPKDPPNFIFVFPKGVIDGAPQIWVATTRVDEVKGANRSPELHF